MAFVDTLAAEPSHSTPRSRQLAVVVFLLAVVMTVASGCGTTKSYTATDQLLMSDAVDSTVAKLDFSPLSLKKVYLDVTYLKTQRNSLLIDSDYVISSLRQQMVSAGVFLVEGREDAEIIAEARLGALGLDGHNVTYGIPSSSALSAASTALTQTPILPTIPEVSLARREAKTGAAKLAVFAYERETREPYWQSGIATATSNARDTWVLGVGPWQRGTIYDGTRFAGSSVTAVDLLEKKSRDIREQDALVAYHESRVYGESEAETRHNFASLQLSSVQDGAIQDSGPEPESTEPAKEADAP